MVAYFGLATIASLRAVGQERMPLRGAATLDRLGYAVVVLFHLILPVCRPQTHPKSAQSCMGGPVTCGSAHQSQAHAIKVHVSTSLCAQARTLHGSPLY